MTRVADLNTYDVCSYNTLLMTKDAASKDQRKLRDHEKYLYSDKKAVVY